MTEEAPTCRTMKDVEQYHGQRVRLIGKYTHKAVFKGQPSLLVSFVILEDETEVVIDYGIDAARMVLLQDQLVAVYGKILKSHPKKEEDYLDLPHLLDMKEIDRIDPDSLAIIGQSSDS